MKPETNAIIRGGIVVVGALGIFTAVAAATKSPYPPIAQAKTAVQDTAIPCTNASLSNRDYLVKCIGGAMTILQGNSYLHSVHTQDFNDLKLWTKALTDGRMTEAAYTDLAFARVNAMLKTARTTNFTGSDDMVWALGDLKAVLGFRRAGIPQVMGPQLAIAD